MGVLAVDGGWPFLLPFFVCHSIGVAVIWPFPPGTNRLVAQKANIGLETPAERVMGFAVPVDKVSYYTEQDRENRVGVGRISLSSL